MQQTLAIALSLHVLAATFWGGSTFALVRMAGNGGERLFAPQMGAAAVAVVTGAYLWLRLHESSFGVTERFLAAGALCALLAAAIQAAVIGGALWTLHRRSGDHAKARSRIIVTHRVAAVLLAVATVAMAAARYA
jgi:hypothetical protein